MAETVTMPKLGFDMAEGTLVRWVIAEGSPVIKGAVLAEIETDKATVEVEAAFDGLVRRHLVSEGTVVPVGTPIAIIGGADEALEVPGEAAPAEKKAAAPQPPTAVPSPTGSQGEAAPGATGLPGGRRASPVARRMAAGLGIDIGALPGSGPLGRVVKRDVETYAASRQALPVAAALPVQPAALTVAAAGAAAGEAAAAAPEPLPAGQAVPMNRLRAAIGRRMTEAKQQVPHFYVTHEYDVAALLELRKQANAVLPEEGKISVNDFIVKAAALALRRFPNLNASLGENQVLRHEQVNIGVAVAVEGGLLTVVCREADRKPLRQVAAEIRTMAARAREGRVRPEDIEGSTFSISNLGMFEVEHFIAIINPPEAAILAVGSARQVPVVKDGQVVAGTRMKATLSVDHRVSDGAEAAQFLQALAEYLEQPVKLLL